MGLFGLFYTAFGLGCKGAMGIKNSIEDSENRTKYRDNECNTYLDHNMTRRDLRTNHRMSVERSYKGDLWLKDCETGHYVRNLSDERAEQQYQMEKAKAARGESDRTHFKYGKNEHYNDTIAGYRYKDFKTGKLYVVRSLFLTQEESKATNRHGVYGTLKYLYALIDSQEKRAVRLTDDAIETLVGRDLTDKEIKEFNDAFIERFNEYINEPYTHFDLTDKFQRGGYDAALQDSSKEGKFISDIRAEIAYKKMRRKQG